MHQIIDGIITMVFLILFVAVGIDLMEAEIAKGDVKDFRNYVALSIENSDYNESVISECIKASKQKGYEIKIKAYIENGESIILDENYIDNTEEYDIELVEITLNYEITMPIFNQSKKESIKIIA